MNLTHNMNLIFFFSLVAFFIPPLPAFFLSIYSLIFLMFFLSLALSASPFFFAPLDPLFAAFSKETLSKALTPGKDLETFITFKALKFIKKMNCKKVLIHDAARPNPSKKLIREIINRINYNHAVVPIIRTSDATKKERNHKRKHVIQR